AIMNLKLTERIWTELDRFAIELPSWGFANTGTRFGKYLQPAAASTVEEKLSDAGQVHALTGACPTVALHTSWDLPGGRNDAAAVASRGKCFGVRPGAINPNLLEEQHYKHGSFGNPAEPVRNSALRHCEESIAIACLLKTRDLSLWFADGSNYP